MYCWRDACTNFFGNQLHPIQITAVLSEQLLVSRADVEQNSLNYRSESKAIQVVLSKADCPRHWNG